MNWNTYPPILAPFLTLQYEQQNATHKEVVWSHDHGWKWPGDARSQPITRHDIDLVCENITYPASRGLIWSCSAVSSRHGVDPSKQTPGLWWLGGLISCYHLVTVSRDCCTHVLQGCSSGTRVMVLCTITLKEMGIISPAAREPS